MSGTPCNYDGILGQIYDELNRIQARTERPPDLSAINAKIATIESQIGELTKQVNQARLETAYLKNESESLFNKIFQMINPLMGLTATVQGLDRRLGTFAGQVNELDELARLANDLARGAKSVADDVKGQVARLGQTVTGLGQNVSNLGKNVASNSKNIGNLASKVTGIITGGVAIAAMALALQNKASIENAFKQIEGVRNYAYQLTVNAINSFNSSIKGLEAHLSDSIERLKDETIKSIDELKNELLELWRKLESLGNPASDFYQSIINQIQGLGARVSTLDNLTSSLKGDIGWLKTQVGNINNIINSLGIGGILSRIGAVERGQSELDRLIKGINGELQNIKDKVAKNTAEIVSAIAAIASLKGLYNLLLAAIGALKNKTVTCRYNDTVVNGIATTTSATNTFITVKYWEFAQKQWGNLAKTLGSVNLVGGVTGALDTLGKGFNNLAKSSVIDRAMNALTFIVVLHNAAMLSRSIVTTLGEALSMGLSAIGIDDEDGNPLDINGALGKQAESLIVSIIGQENWTQTKKTWALASRTVQASANIIYTMRSIMDSSLEIGLWTAEQLAKIGNSLRDDGVVERFSYPPMPEIQFPHSRLINRLNNLDEAAASVSVVTSEMLSVHEESEELFNQTSELNQARKELLLGFGNDPKVATDKQTEKIVERESTEDKNSESPAITTEDMQQK